MKLVRMKIAGYRSLVDVEFAVRPLTVLIGPNGSGKTSLLDTFSFLQAGMQNDFPRALIQRGGLQAMLSRVQPKASELELLLEFEGSNRLRFLYTLAFGIRENQARLVRERIERVRRDGLVDSSLTTIGGLHVTDLDLPNLAPRVGEWDSETEARTLDGADASNAVLAIRLLLVRLAAYQPLDVGPRSAVRLPQILEPTTAPLAGGDNLFSVLYNLREHHQESYQRILDVLRLTFPGFQRLEFPIVGAGQVNLAWHQADLAGPLYSNELSDGTLRFLWLTTILLTPEPPPLVLIDEPESSLHPQMLRVLAELMQDAALRTTVIVATHATELIRWLKPDEVLVLDKEDGRTRATWADEMDLDAWLREYTLSDLWLTGNLGGRS